VRDGGRPGAEGSRVLLVGDLLHPIGALPVERLHDRDVRHGDRGRGAVPVLLAGRDPREVAHPDLVDGVSPPLDAAHAARHDERLSERMAVPCRPCSRFERHTGAGRASRRARLELLIHRTDPVKLSAGPRREVCASLRVTTMALSSDAVAIADPPACCPWSGAALTTRDTIAAADLLMAFPFVRSEAKPIIDRPCAANLGVPHRRAPPTCHLGFALLDAETARPL